MTEDKSTTPATAPAEKPTKKRRRKRTYVLIRTYPGSEGGDVVRKATTMAELRDYTPESTPEDVVPNYQEAVLLGTPFSLKRVETVVRTRAK